MINVPALTITQSSQTVLVRLGNLLIILATAFATTIKLCQLTANAMSSNFLNPTQGPVYVLIINPWIQVVVVTEENVSILKLGLAIVLIKHLSQTAHAQRITSFLTTCAPRSSILKF